MEHRNVYAAKITQISSIGSKFMSYTDLLNWLILRGCFSTPGGPPIVKEMVNI